MSTSSWAHDVAPALLSAARAPPPHPPRFSTDMSQAVRTCGRAKDAVYLPIDHLRSSLCHLILRLATGDSIVAHGPGHSAVRSYVPKQVQTVAAAEATAEGADSQTQRLARQCCRWPTPSLGMVGVLRALRPPSIPQVGGVYQHRLGSPKAVEEWGRAGRARGESNGARSATEGLGAAEQANKQASDQSKGRLSWAAASWRDTPAGHGGESLARECEGCSRAALRAPNRGRGAGEDKGRVRESKCLHSFAFARAFTRAKSFTRHDHTSILLPRR